MNEAILREYAELIVKIGANVQKGQRVRLQTGVDQVQLATMVTEECYKAGASYVEVIWECGPINKLNYQYASAETLGTVQTWEEERLKQMTVDLPVRIFIDSSDPDELAGISADLLSTVRLVKRSLNPRLVLEGVLLTMFDGRTNLSIQVVEEVKRHFGKKVFATVVPRNVRLSEAPSHGEPITAYDRYCRGAEAYMALAQEFLRRNEA